MENSRSEDLYFVLQFVPVKFSWLLFFIDRVSLYFPSLHSQCAPSTSFFYIVSHVAQLNLYKKSMIHSGFVCLPCTTGTIPSPECLNCTLCGAGYYRNFDYFDDVCQPCPAGEPQKWFTEFPFPRYQTTSWTKAKRTEAVSHPGFFSLIRSRFRGVVFHFLPTNAWLPKSNISFPQFNQSHSGRWRHPQNNFSGNSKINNGFRASG